MVVVRSSRERKMESCTTIIDFKLCKMKKLEIFCKTLYLQLVILYYTVKILLIGQISCYIIYYTHKKVIDLAGLGSWNLSVCQGRSQQDVSCFRLQHPRKTQKSEAPTTSKGQKLKTSMKAIRVTTQETEPESFHIGGNEHAND